ncbi:protein-L-isoaspartate(D-aspartate) O-methyltransferase [Streptomyces sp. NPDC020681]|uniref:protein-L-isoaspartate(D-aspartate) O-methyltransferase n=1 Tax=Streptomyces sp. NPDC020681 TaxID=3365083 RepID=UPI0037A87C43
MVTVEVDAAVAGAARDALARFGLPLHVVTGDGVLGCLDRAPYDRIKATCGMRSVPFAWVEQTRPGGLILLPWGTSYSHLDATVRLAVAQDGQSASGPFLHPVEFMKLRAQRVAWPEHTHYVPDDRVADAVRSSTSMTEDGFGVGQFEAAAFAVGLQVRGCVRAVADKRDGARPVWFYSLTDRSWAVVMFRDQSQSATVHQAGSRCLWNEVEAAWRWWDSHGRPGFERFGLTVTAEGQTAWLDAPVRPVPIVS